MPKFAPLFLGSILLAVLGALYLWHQPAEERAASPEAPYLITQRETQQPPPRAPVTSQSAIIEEEVEGSVEKTR